MINFLFLIIFMFLRVSAFQNDELPRQSPVLVRINTVLQGVPRIINADRDPTVLLIPSALNTATDKLEYLASTSFLAILIIGSTLIWLFVLVFCKILGRYQLLCQCGVNYGLDGNNIQRPSIAVAIKNAKTQDILQKMTQLLSAQVDEKSTSCSSQAAEETIPAKHEKKTMDKRWNNTSGYVGSERDLYWISMLQRIERRIRCMRLFTVSAAVIMLVSSALLIVFGFYPVHHAFGTLQSSIKSFESISMGGEGSLDSSVKYLRQLGYTIDSFTANIGSLSNVCPMAPSAGGILMVQALNGTLVQLDAAKWITPLEKAMQEFTSFVNQKVSVNSEEKAQDEFILYIQSGWNNLLSLFAKMTTKLDQEKYFYVCFVGLIILVQVLTTFFIISIFKAMKRKPIRQQECSAEYLLYPVYIVFIIFTVFVTAFLASVSVFNSDFCFADVHSNQDYSARTPAGKKIQKGMMDMNMKPYSDMYLIASYYLQECRSNTAYDPFLSFETMIDHTNNLIAQRRDFQVYLDSFDLSDFIQACGTDATNLSSTYDYLKQLDSDAQSLLMSTRHVNDYYSCERVFPLYTAAIDGGICKEALEGNVTASMLLVITVFTGLMVVTLRSSWKDVIDSDDKDSHQSKIQELSEQQSRQNITRQTGDDKHNIESDKWYIGEASISTLTRDDDYERMLRRFCSGDMNRQ